MTTSRVRWPLPWALLVAAFASGCNHEPFVERRGGPLPDADVTPVPPECDTGGGEGGGAGASTTRVTFCQAERVLRESCQRCHANPPEHGAPFPLVTYGDTQHLFDVDKPRWKRMEEVVESGFMPIRLRLEPPVEPLTCEQKTTLLAWLASCAQPEGGAECEGRNEELLSCD